MKAKQLQENNVDIAPVTHEDIVFDNNGKNIPNKYQTKEDNTLNTTDKTIVGAINELFQNVSSGKELIATAITDKGVTTSSDDSFQTMADNIELIEGGSNLPSWYEGWSSSPADTPISMSNGMDVANNKIYYMYKANSYCYDANNNEWTTKTPMPTSRGLLNLITVDDKIYCFGGEISSTSYSTANECYDPLTDSWTTKGEVINNYYLMSKHPTVSYNHKLYYLGYEVFCYDTISDTWTKLGKSGFYGDDGKITRAMASVVNGIAYVFGGFRDSFATSAFNCYDINTDTWSSLDNMPVARESGSVCTVNDKIYIMGGHNTTGNLKDNKLYDPSTNTWEDKESMLNARGNFKLNLIDDIIYAVGGGTLNECYTVAENLKSENGELRIGKELIATAITNKGVVTNNDDSFQTMADNIGLISNGNSNNLPNWYKQIWIEAEPLPIATYGVAVASVGNKIYAMNARTGNTTLGNTNYCYNVETNTWEEKATIPTARLYAGASAVGDKIYCISGYALSKLSYDNECYDTSTDTWSAKANIRYNSEEMACVSIDTNIYCIGGWTSSSNNTSANQCYDTLTDTWSLKTNMPTARGGLTGSATDNKIYCIGGQKTYEESSVTSINECYDVSTDTWSTKANMSISRTSLSSVVVNNKIYCIGGVNRFNSQYFEINECYNVSNDTWGSKTNMTVGKSRFGIACVNNMIFCIGGSNSSNAYIDTNYCYIIENDN